MYRKKNIKLKILWSVHGANGDAKTTAGTRINANTTLEIIFAIFKIDCNTITLGKQLKLKIN